MGITSSPLIPLLSILIPTLASRRDKLAELMAVLKPHPELEILTHEDNGELKIGAKRNAMTARATGRYLCHLDDDDLLAPDFFATVAPHLTGPDLIAYDAGVSFNGGPEFRVTTSLGALNQQPRPLGGERYSDIARTPWLWCCWRTDFARRFRFREDQNWTEDAHWLEQALPCVKSWHKIDRVLFHHRWSQAGTTSDVNR